MRLTFDAHPSQHVDSALHRLFTRSTDDTTISVGSLDGCILPHRYLHSLSVSAFSGYLHTRLVRDVGAACFTESAACWCIRPLHLQFKAHDQYAGSSELHVPATTNCPVHRRLYLYAFTHPLPNARQSCRHTLRVCSGVSISGLRVREMDGRGWGILRQSRGKCFIATH